MNTSGHEKPVPQADTQVWVRGTEDGKKSP